MTRLRAHVRTALGWFPLTPGGLLLLAASAVGVWVYGAQRADLLLLVIGGLGLVVAVAAVIGVVLGTLRVWLIARRPVSEDIIDAECGSPAVTGFALPTLWWLPWVHVSWRWLHPEVTVSPVRRRGWMRERVVPRRRAEADHVVREITVSDAFGVARVRFVRRSDRSFRAVPNTGALEQIHVVQGLAGGDAIGHPEGAPVGDRFDMRHYGPGDPIRFVLWKVFAKSRDLVIRTPERAISPVQRTVAYLVSGAGDEPAAGAARVVVGRGALGGDWSLGADGVGGEARTVATAMDCIVKSADADPAESGSGLAAFLAASPGGTRRAVVFVPPVPGPWLTRVVAAAATGAGGANLDFCVCIDGLGRAQPRGVASRLLLRDAETRDDRAHLGDLSEVVRVLSQTRGQVLVVDRIAGQMMPASHLRALGVA